MGYRVLLYYWFTKIGDPTEFARAHAELCESLGLRGRILIAEEGINGTVSGPTQNCERYMSVLVSDPRFSGMEFKIDEADGHVFKAMHVRVRNEIITLGRTLGHRVEEKTGTALDPQQWRNMMDRDDVVILDGRNAYESEVGRFRGALCPNIQNFRELPEWIEDNRHLLIGKKILTYCTGGIRCEKLTTWMIEAGFEDVYQLRGGIVQYGKDVNTRGDGFEGVNVVFDERIAVSAGEKATIITYCRECGVESANYVNCANVECNLRMIQCPSCEELAQRCCCVECRSAPRRRVKGKKWHESVTRTASVRV